MALKPDTNFAGKINPATSAYPYGSARNVTTQDDGTGTPFIDLLINDNFGWQQALLDEAGIVPSGSPDNVLNSQYLEALNKLFRDSSEILVPTFSALGTGTTISGYVLKTSDIVALYNNGGLLKTVVNNTTSNTGGASYKILTTAEKDASEYAGTEGYACIEINGSGYWACLVISDSMRSSSFGVCASLSDNSMAMQSMINLLKNGGCTILTLDKGTYNVKCFDQLAIGRAAVEFRDIKNITFVGSKDTEFKAVTGGFGTAPFSIFRLDKNTKNIVFKNIIFNGDYSNNPEFEGQTANVSSGVIVANWDFSQVAGAQTSYEDFSIEGITFDTCSFIDIGGGIATRRKSANKARGGYTSVTVKGCTFLDAQQSNNSIGADYAHSWLITRNTFRTTKALSDTVWTIAVDMSRGGVLNEISYNTVDKYHYGIKFEYNIAGGVSGTDIENSEVSSIHHNSLTDIGHPTLDNGPGASASGSYGIRMSGSNLSEYDNKIVGLYNADNVGAENRLVQGVWSNHVGVVGTNQSSERGSISNAQVAVNHNSSSNTNTYTCSFKKIRDCGKGIVLQAGGSALFNDLRRLQDSAINMQIQDKTIANNNYIFDVDKSSTGNGAIKGDPSSGATLKYWEVKDNYIDTVDNGAGTGVVMNGAFVSAVFSFIYKAGVIVNTTANENQELVSDVLKTDAVKMRLTANPATRAIINSYNVKQLNAIDANTFEIVFLKPMPSSSYQFTAIEPNQSGTINFISFGATTTTLRLRSTNNTGTPVALPASVMVSIM